MSYRLLIDGKLTDGEQSLDVVNPATGAPFATCARASKAQLDQAIAAAKRAGPAWAALSFAERGQYLTRLADALEARADEFARTLTGEQGKPLAEASGEVAGAIGLLRHYAAQELPPVCIKDDGESRIVEYRVPLGVVAAISPWNFPTFITVLKIAPALCAGNTVVAKPAATTPLTIAMFGELAAEILPAGVLNVIIDDNDLGSHLTSHPDVAKISFTGSTRTGKRVMESAASTIKRLTLELGGNDPAIVLDDADPEATARVVFDAAMGNAGQVCVAAKRVYVPRESYDLYADIFARMAGEVVVGDGIQQGTQMGPLQNRLQYERVLELIEDASQRGTIIAGGKALDGAGYFVEPTIVRDIPDDSRLVAEEQFGPVMPLLAYDNFDELIERVNNTDFALAATVWTGKLERGIALAQRIESGVVWVNKHMDMSLDVPFGGAKQSGLGREHGAEGLREYTQPKLISVAL